jgi:hypothetical protein
MVLSKDKVLSEKLIKLLSTPIPDALTSPFSKAKGEDTSKGMYKGARCGAKSQTSLCVSQLPTSKSSSQEESTFMPNDFKT